MNEATLTREEILAWPKAELHCHLDGSLRLSTLLDLARAQGKFEALPSDSLEGLERALMAIEDGKSLDDFLAWFRYTIPVMQDEASLRRVAYELAEDAAAENVEVLEVRFGPVLHTHEGLTMEEVVDAVLDGLARAEKDLGIRTGLIVCGLRNMEESVSLRQAELAVAYRDRGVVAFDLAGGEAGHPAKDHLSAFYHARNHLLKLTIHAGEAWGPDSIHQALLYNGAHRIGHGISLVRDPDLMRYVADRQICLEICPSSNVQTKAVESFETHPIRELAAAGVPVSVNTDNRLFTRTSMTEELWRAHTRCGVPASSLRKIALHGFRHAFLPWEEKQDRVHAARKVLGANGR